MYDVREDGRKVKNNKLENVQIPSQAAESGSPPSPYIMGGSNSSEALPYVSSFDTIHLSCRLFYRRQYLLEYLKERKEYLQTTEDTEIPLRFAQGCGLEWNLQRTGTKLYSFILKCGDLVVMLSPRKFDSTIPNCRIEIGSMSCWAGSLAAYEKITYFLSVNGAECRFNQVSRCDIACDFVGVPIESIGMFDRGRYWVCRATKFNYFEEHRKVTGIQYGRGNILLRVYDKTHEIKTNAAKSVFFREIWGQPGEVTRVEFQLRRKALKEFQSGNADGFRLDVETKQYVPVFACETIEDIHSNADKMWQYLTTRWARLIGKSVDRKNNNQSHTEPNDFWQLVMSARPTTEHLVRVKKSVIKDIEALKKQARGILLSIIAAKKGTDSNDVRDVIDKAKRLASSILMEYIMADFTEYQKKFAQRKIESGSELADRELVIIDEKGVEKCLNI